MFDKLILDAFKKAKIDTNSEIVSQLSKHISDVLLEDYKFQVSERTLRNYYNKIKKEEEEEDISMSSQISLNLSKYLGYEDFKDFIADNNEVSSHKSKGFKNYNKLFTSVAIAIIVILLGYLGYDSMKKECMIWVDNTHYERVSCEEGMEEGAVLYNEVTLDKFSRVEPDCNYQFFKPNGTENLWYLKGKNGNLEYFTLHGYHPITKKTLKPITQYIIDKYICDTED